MPNQQYHPLTSWMIEWSASIITRYAVKSNCKTSIEEIKGRRAVKPIVEVGEKVAYNLVRSSANPTAKVDARVETGLWLGLCLTSDEVYIGIHEGVIRVKDVRRLLHKDK